MTIKILDATVVSTATLCTPSLNFLTRCGDYDLRITPEVQGELEGCRTSICREGLRAMGPKHPNYRRILEYLQARHPNLHMGELSSFLHAYLECQDEPCYFVTDDLLMRKKIAEIVEDPMFIDLSGVRPWHLRHTGTVGLIVRLVEKGFISREEAGRLHADLKDSHFHASARVLEPLRQSATR